MNKEKLKKLASIFAERFSGAQITNSSVLIAYYMLLSLFPLAVVVGNLLPYLRIDAPSALDYLEVIVPAAVRPVLEPIIQGLLTQSSGGLITVGSIALLWSASKGINYLQLAMNRAYGVTPQTGFVFKRLLSLITLLVIIVLVIALVLVFGFGETLLNLLGPAADWAQPLADQVKSLKWPVTLGILFLIMLVLYYITPDTIIRVRDAVPGAVLTTLGLLTLVEAFALYVEFATRSLSSYGTLSAFFVLMFWLNFSAMVVIAGGVLNASIHEYRFGKAEEDKSGLAMTVRNRLLDKLETMLGKKLPIPRGGEEDEQDKPEEKPPPCGGPDDKQDPPQES